MVDCDGNNPPWISAAAGKWHTQPNTDSWREGRCIRIKRIITIFFLKSVTLVSVVTIVVVVIIICKTVLIIIAIGDYHNLCNRLGIYDDHHYDEGAPMVQ